MTIPASVFNLGDWAFEGCWNLSSVFFQGDQPSIGASVFNQDDEANIYYLPGHSGWSDSLAGRPALLWNPQMILTASELMERTNRFEFTIVGTKDIPIVIEAASGLAGSGWVPLQSCHLTNGAMYFSDPEGLSPSRFYRVRSP